MFMLLLLLHLLPSISTSLTRELCIDSQGNRMCLLWNCPDQQSLETCAEQYVLAVCDSNLATSDPQIQSCCTTTDKICVSKLIQTTYQTLQQTSMVSGFLHSQARHCLTKFESKTQSCSSMW